MEGIIVKSISNNWTVDVKGEKIVCQARGKLKYDKITPLVGDKVIISEEHFIEKVLPRKK
jgi:Predicted GTPases